MDISTTQTTANMQRDIYEPLSQYGYTFSTPYYYSGVTFAATSQDYIDCIDQGETLLGECRDLSICVLEASTYTNVVQRLLPGSNIVLVEFSDDLFTNFADEICNVISGSTLLIYEERVREVGYKGDYVFAPRIYDPEPFALTTRGDDVEFGDFVNWLLRALIVADTLNIDSSNYEEFPSTDLFGPLYENMFRNAIQAVGNYGSMYDRYLQDRSPRRPGGINTPHLFASDGGLLYANPLGDISNIEDGLSDGLLFLGPTEGGTIERILDRGTLRCGILPYDSHGNSRKGLAVFNETTQSYNGMDIDYCKGITGSLFEGKIVEGETYELVVCDTIDDGFVDLTDNSIDILVGATYDIVNDVKHPITQQGYAFSDIYYYYQVGKLVDGSGFDIIGDDYDTTTHEEIIVDPIAIATREEDVQFTDFIRSLVTSTIYAEATGITAGTAVDMPIIELFGSTLQQSLREIILAVGNYEEIYTRNMERFLPRSNNARNTLNTGGNPQFYSNWKF